MALVVNNEPQSHLRRDITVGIIDKRSTHLTDSPWVSSNHYNATEYGMLIDIGAMGHLYDIDAIALCDVILLRISLSNSKRMREKWRYLQIAHVFGIEFFIVAVTPHSKKQFDEMRGNIERMMKQMNIDKFRIIPLSNPTENNDYSVADLPTADWYDGPSVMETITEFRASVQVEEGPCLLRIFCCVTNSIIGCKVRRGTISVGDNIKIFPSGIRGKVISIHKHSKNVDEAQCGDIVALKLKSRQKLLRNVKPGAMIMFDEDPGQAESIGILYRFSAIIDVLPSLHEIEEKFVMKYWPKHFEESTHDITSRNGRSRCRIVSADWEQKGRGRAHRRARVKMEVDSDYSFESMPFNVYPEFDSFFMEFTCSNNKKSGKSFIFGKVTDILETKKICSIYRRHHRRKRTQHIVQNPARFCHCYALELLEKSISEDWTRTKAYGFERLCDRCKDLSWDDFKESIKLRRHSTPCNVDDVNICLVLDKFSAWSCNGTLSLEVLTYFCAQNGRALKILIPSEVVQIIVRYSRSYRVPFRYRWKTWRWEPIEALKGKNIRKMVSKYYKGASWSRYQSARELYLEEDGNVWYKEPTDHSVRIVPYFMEHRIAITDIAVGRSHYLALDTEGRVYSWDGDWNGRRGLIPNSLKVIDFPNLQGQYRCVAIKCGEYRSYARLRALGSDHSDNAWHSDLHFLLGGWKRGRQELRTPICINDTMKQKIGGVIEDVIFKEEERETVTTVLLMNHFQPCSQCD